ncbi:hypothetical protein [Aurantiacibacter spongiae]|uniref:Scaffolding protein n=1 Tax=Aurantiacibacter spongiae TaxID=2488860 RepID=A0A3N5DN42_9SPHN|nr:hypothetical protein [Aurantiacibacter spongiae]RPF70451.1 hypothetical protein EG799_01510 [Aurantiacibacter spongiae]
MADQPEEDVLELDPEQEIDETEEAEPEDGEATENPDEDETEEQPEETYFGFDGEDEGAAPAPESESSVIRELRERNRELTAQLKAAETGKREEQIEVGPEPTIEDDGIDYDAEKFAIAWREWNERKARAERQEQEKAKEREQEAAKWGEVQRAYETDKASLNIPNFDEAEAQVAAILPESHRALLLKSGKGAALVAALHRSPTTLEELSKLDPADAAMKIGELRSKVQMKTRARPQPDRPVKGNAAPTSADKELERLEKEAERTGDRTKVIRYKKELRSRA